MNFEERNIALIGEADICKFFYLQFRSVLNIEYIFTINMDYVFCDQFSVKCMPLKEDIIIEKNLLLVLCTEHLFRQTYDELLFYKGFEWGTDYIDCLYVVQYYRHKYNVEMEKKKIWIFGAGNNGRNFYEEYKELYHICGFISNMETEKEYLGLPVVRPDCLSKMEKCYVVICSDASILMSRQLIALGYRGDRDYGFPFFLPKKLFIAMGTCQIAYTTEILIKNKSFNLQFSTSIYFENIYEPGSDSDHKRLKSYGEFCDVVFFNVRNAGALWQRDYELLLNRYYKNAERLYLPFYSFKGQLMQAVDQINPYALKIVDGNRGYLWWRGDKEINHMVEDQCTPEEIFCKLSRLDYWSQESVNDNFVKELKKIEIWDRFSSFPIKPFIEANYKEKLLFNDGIHFSNHLGLYLANEIAKHLCLKEITEREIINETENRLASEMPVYPCVRYALGLHLEEKVKFYNLKRDELEYLSFEEYIRRYAEYIADTCDFFEKVGTFYR